MRVLCIGDSLALPREECPYESTWFYRLRQAFPQHEFIDFFKRGLLISDALHMFDTYYQFYDSDVVIIQTGICDCSPRYINDTKRLVVVIKSIFKKLGVESIFWKIVKLRKRRQTCVYTKFDRFKSEYEQLVHKLILSGVNHIILVKIGHAAPSVLPRNPRMNENVDNYNSVIDQLAGDEKEGVVAVDPLNDAPDEYFVDGYHCNPKGMDVVYEQIRSVFLQTNAAK